jgi:hypothetical protein
MASLQTILTEYRSAAGSLPTFDGGTKATIAPSRIIDRESLKSQLEAVEKRNQVYFQICFGVVVVLFVASLGIICLNVYSGAGMKALLTFIQGVAALLVGWMLKLWREKNNTELLLSLALYTEGDALQRVIDLLADGLKPSNKLKNR